MVGLDIWDWSMLLGGSLLVCFAALLAWTEPVAPDDIGPTREPELDWLLKDGKIILTQIFARPRYTGCRTESGYWGEAAATPRTRAHLGPQIT